MCDVGTNYSAPNPTRRGVVGTPPSYPHAGLLLIYGVVLGVDRAGMVVEGRIRQQSHALEQHVLDYDAHLGGGI